MDFESFLQSVKEASFKLSLMHESLIDHVLKRLADSLEEKSNQILFENQIDLEKIDKNDPIYDRVLLNEERIKGMAYSVREIAGYKSPIDEIIEEKTLENGLSLKKVRTPLGVVGVIFEARPNVVIDIFALCFKAKNACILKGGSKSDNSNRALVQIIKEVLEENHERAFEKLSATVLSKNFDPHVPVSTLRSKFSCRLVSNSFSNAPKIIEILPNDRDLMEDFLKANKYVDVIIPRGGKELIDFVRNNASVPVIETGAGVVHTYFDESGDLQKGKKIVFNAKVSRPSVCNALDTLIVHSSRISDIPTLCEELSEKKVEIRADEPSFKALSGNYPFEFLKKASEEDFGVEYLSLKMSIKIVDELEKAVSHINIYGSGHSEAIITENKNNAEIFLKSVDAACVYVNASTRFTDGGVFGLGAEVGISTQKLHARGPMGVKELTGYKWEIIGDGQVR